MSSITVCMRNLLEGNVFSHVCLSVRGRGNPQVTTTHNAISQSQISSDTLHGPVHTSFICSYWQAGGWLSTKWPSYFTCFQRPQRLCRTGTVCPSLLADWKLWYSEFLLTSYQREPSPYPAIFLLFPHHWLDSEKQNRSRSTETCTALVKTVKPFPLRKPSSNNCHKNFFSRNNAIQTIHVSIFLYFDRIYFPYGWVLLLQVQ